MNNTSYNVISLRTEWKTLTPFIFKRHKGDVSRVSSSCGWGVGWLEGWGLGVRYTVRVIELGAIRLLQISFNTSPYTVVSFNVRNCI